uniref:Uncharacterized protein n=1 Tax=Anopheles dirus TaxID=7168 RepID=A0A182NSZ4_9DIPT
MYIVERFRALVRYHLERRSCDTRVQLTLLVQKINFVGGLLGLDVFTPNYSTTGRRFRLLVLNMFVFSLINLYSLNVSYGDLVNFMYCLETILYVGIAGIKMDVFVRHNRLICKLHQFMTEFYARCRGDPDQDRLLGAITLDTYVLVLLFGFCSSSAAALIFVYSLAWSATVEYALPFGFFIPTVGIEQLKGFLMNFAFQLFESFLMVAGLVSSEGAFFMFLLQACLQLDMLRLDFAKSLCSLFELHFFVVFGCIFCQLVSIVVVVVSVPDWYPGYFLFFMLTFQLFFSCALGQMFDIKCDELTVAIYNVPWYSMEVQDQKAMRLLLMASQHPGRLSYGFGSVNMQAFFEIYRRTYSIGMMMISVSEDE